jgi:hypothetical protein
MNGGVLVLDNVILSGFHTAGWFESLEFWTPEYTIVVPQKIWETEFMPFRDLEEPPSWLDVRPLEDQLRAEAPGVLSDNDWRCIGIAEECSGVLITRDQALKQRAEQRGVSTIWGGRFLIDTFSQCGITIQSFDEGVETYLEDAHLSQSVENEIRETEKE